MKGEHYGKFRGTVVDNVDPLFIGRLMVMVPDVSNIIPSTWAMPCFPFAGIQNGFFAVPAIGSGVWVEYEQGDPDYPIWSGCFFGTMAETPALALATPPGLQGIVIQTVGQNTLMISDTPGPTGGFSAQDHHRRHAFHLRYRDHHQQRSRRDHPHGRSVGHHQRRRTGGCLMAGFLLHQGATVMCLHGGQAMPSVPNPRVLVMGMPTATIAAPWVIAGCPGIPIPIPPCVTGQWLLGTLRVTSMGQPLTVQSGAAITAPGGVTLLPITMQTRVQAM